MKYKVNNKNLSKLIAYLKKETPLKVKDDK